MAPSALGCYYSFNQPPLPIMAEQRNDTSTWPELAIGLFDKLTGRGAEITYEFDGFELEVPSSTGSEERAHWRMNGILRIRTSDDTSRTGSSRKAEK